MKAPRLIMMIGIPGCGKGTWLKKQILSNKPLNHIVTVSPDRIRQEKYADISCQANNVEVWAIAKSRTVDFLSNGTSVILDATNVNTTYRRQFINNLPPCILQAKVIKEDPEKCWERIQQDLNKAVDRADVPKEVIYRMYVEFLYTLQVLESEGFHLIEEL